MAELKTYTVEREYRVPCYVHITLAAESAEAAAREAMDEDTYGWDRAKISEEAASPHYITGIWEGEAAYVGECFAPPADVGDPDERLPTVRSLICAIDEQRQAWAARQAPAGHDNAGSDQEEADTVVGVLDDVLRAACAKLPEPETEPLNPDFAAIVQPLEGLADGQTDELGEMLADVRDTVIQTLNRFAAVERASRALIDAYGGDVPDWLLMEVGMLEKALIRLGNVKPDPRVPEKVTVVANMTGGVLQGCSADYPVDLIVLDYDARGYGDEDQEARMCDIPGEGEAEVLQEGARVDPEFCATVVQAIAKRDNEESEGN